jgi:hypothetical protein
MSTKDGEVYKVTVNGIKMELSPSEFTKINQNNMSEMWFTNKNTWGFYLNQVPFAKSLRDTWRKNGPSSEDVLNSILSTTVRREQLAILSLISYAWNGDQGNGAYPRDEDVFDGTDF